MAGAGAGEPETCLAPLVGGTDVARPGPPGSAWPARGTVQVLGPLTEAALCVFLVSWGQGKLPGVPSMSARSRAVDGLCASTLASRFSSLLEGVAEQGAPRDSGMDALLLVTGSSDVRGEPHSGAVEGDPRPQPPEGRRPGRPPRAGPGV